MKLNKKHIPIIAALIQTVQFSFAGYIYAGWIGCFILGIMGALVSLVVSYGSSQLADVAEKRKRQSVVAMIAVLFFSPVLVGTATWIHLTTVTNVYWRGVVSFAWGTLADLSPLLAGFVAGKGLFEQGNKPKNKIRRAQQTTKGRSAKKKSLSKPLSEILCRYAGAGCNRTFPSQNAANAHAAKCGFKPTIAMPIDVSSKEGKQI
jgi:hypothetical protein